MVRDILHPQEAPPHRTARFDALLDPLDQMEGPARFALQERSSQIPVHLLAQTCVQQTPTHRQGALRSQTARATRAITLTSREADAIVAPQTPIAQEASQSYPAVPIPTPLRAAPRFQTALAMQDTRAPISGRVCIALPENTNPSQDLQRAWIAAVAPIPLLWQHRLCQHASRARQALNLLWGAGHSPAVRVLEGLLGLMAVPAQYVILESTNQAPALRRV